VPAEPQPQSRAAFAGHREPAKSDASERLGSRMRGLTARGLGSEDDFDSAAWYCSTVGGGPPPGQAKRHAPGRAGQGESR